MSKPIYAWHFIQSNKRLRFEPHIEIKVGETLTCDPDKLELCRYGFHASTNPLDALSFVSWSDGYICRVRLSGKILKGEDKCCASERTVLWMAQVDKCLHEFACLCAEDVLPVFENKYPDDNRPRKAIEAKRLWLQGKITTEELEAACAAADAAADEAADAAADEAADAATEVAWAVWTARSAPVRKEQSKQLHKMLMQLKKGG